MISNFFRKNSAMKSSFETIQENLIQLQLCSQRNTQTGIVKFQNGQHISQNHDFVDRFDCKFFIVEKTGNSCPATVAVILTSTYNEIYI